MRESYAGSNFMPLMTHPITRWLVGSQMIGSVGKGLSRTGDRIAAMLILARTWKGTVRSSTLTGILSRELLPTLLVAQGLSGIFVPKCKRGPLMVRDNSGVQILGCV